MANPPDITQIPAPRVDFIDKRTGLMAREWYRFFVNIYDIAGGGNSSVSLDDVQVSPSGGASYDSIAEMMKTLQELEIQPPVVPSSGGTTYSVFTSTTNGLAPASGGGTVNYLRADGTWATPPGTGGVTFANPTALVGSTAVNGVATTVMRSDAAPAIDLTANYTYTGQWTFSRASTTSALNIYASATTWQCVLGFAGTAEFKMDIASSATGLGVYVTGTKYLAVTAGNVDVPAGTLTVASTSVRDGGILTSGTVAAARLPTFGTAAAGIVPLSGGGTTNFLRADGTWAAPGGGTAGNPTASLGLTAINGVAATYMRSDAAPALSVSIAPTWTATHNFTAATGMGVVSPTAVLHLKAGTATASTAPLKLNSGTNLTTAEAGAMEYDGVVSYFTNDASSGRGYHPAVQIFRLTASGAAIGPTIANFFGANSAVQLAAAGVYEIEAYCYFTKTTANTVTVTATTSLAPVNLNGSIQYGAGAGGTATGAANEINLFNSASTAAIFGASVSLTTAVNHLFIIRLIVEANASASNLRINFTSATGTVTPLRGSYYKVTRLPAGNSGVFVA